MSYWDDQMTKAAQQKRDDMLERWSDMGVGEQTLDALRLSIQQVSNKKGHKPPEYISVNDYAKVPSGKSQGLFNTKAKLEEYKGGYIGDKRNEKSFTLNQYDFDDLDEFVDELKEYELVSEVYVLSDDREETGLVTILLRLSRLDDFTPEQLETRNKILTGFLRAASLKGAQAIAVNFQYTEVY